MELKKTSESTINQASIDKPLLREIAYQKLLDAIQVGEYKPGESLNEIRLSEKLQISRTPVRAALHQLVLEGLVKNIPNRAMTVAEPTVQDVMNALHIRSLIDPEIARLVAGAASDSDVHKLETIVTELGTAAAEDDRTRWSRVDTAFHETMTEACPNQLLGQLGLQMRNRMHLVAIDKQTSNERLIACTEEHAVVVEAIAARDADQAKETMLVHIQRLRESFFARFSHV